MGREFKLIFDEVIIKQLRKLGEQQNTKTLISKMLDKIELLGPRAGKLIDSKLQLYEVKSKRPPIRLYFRQNQINEIYLFEYEFKKSVKDQQESINKIRYKSKIQDLSE